MLGTSTKVLALQEHSNKTSLSQSMELSFSDTVSNTSTFTHRWGASVSTGTKFTCGLPCIAEGKIDAKLSASVSLTWGKSETIQRKCDVKIPVKIGPYSKVTCEVVVNESKLEVPYTMHFKSGKTSKGMWSGVSTWNVKTSCKEIKLNPDEIK